MSRTQKVGFGFCLLPISELQVIESGF